MNKEFNLGLNLVTNKQTLKGRDLSETIEIALKNGADSVRLREKNMDTRSIMREAFKIKEITQSMGKLLIVNDRVDIAKACDVDGVHLGQKDMPIKLLGLVVTRWNKRWRHKRLALIILVLGLFFRRSLEMIS